MAGQRLGFAQALAGEELQADHLFGVGMGDFSDQLARLYLNAQFLLELPPQADFEGFARFALAAGELPQTAEMIAGPPLSDQEPAVAKDQAGGDVNGPGDGGFQGIAQRRPWG